MRHGGQSLLIAASAKDETVFIFFRESLSPFSLLLLLGEEEKTLAMVVLVLQSTFIPGVCTQLWVDIIHLTWAVWEDGLRICNWDYYLKRGRNKCLGLKKTLICVDLRSD